MSRASPLRFTVSHDEPEPAQLEPIRAPAVSRTNVENRRATAAVDAACSRKWCASCKNFRPIEGGAFRRVAGKTSAGRSLWRCERCAARARIALRAIKMGNQK